LKVRVGFTPVDEVSAPLGIVIDVLRATSTICQALASGWERVVCTGEIDDARALAGPGVALAGERANVRIEGFDFGNSPREFKSGGGTIVLTTTNGTRLLLAAAARCDEVIVASLLNLGAVVETARKADEVAILCAGVERAFAIDDAYVAGRIAQALGGEPDDAAEAAVRLAQSFPVAEAGIGGGVSAANIRNAGLDEDIPFCAQESVLDVVPRIVARSERSVEIRP
jgi:2-phosphosulfolactate phosphatase